MAGMGCGAGKGRVSGTEGSSDIGDSFCFEIRVLPWGLKNQFLTQLLGAIRTNGMEGQKMEIKFLRRKDFPCASLARTGLDLEAE